MKKFIKPAVFALGLLGVTSQASAHVFPGGSLMTFDNGGNATGANITPGPMAASVFPAFGNSYIEQGIQFSAIGFGTTPGNSIGTITGGGSHVHGETMSATDPNHVVALLSDSGGGMFQLTDHAAFGVGGVDIANMNFGLLGGGQTTMTIRGYTAADYSSFVDVILGGGADGFTATSVNGDFLTEAGNVVNGFNGTHLHLDGVAALQNVYLVEYFYDSLGRGIDGSLNSNLGNLITRLDNLQLIAPAAVPLPAAVYLFGTGIIGLFGAGRKRRNASTVAA